MKSTFKTRFWKLMKWSALLFAALFVFRLTYGYFEPGSRNYEDYSNDFFSNISDLKKNYASEKISGRGEAAPPLPGSGQKFEKTATVRSKTTHFDNDEKLIKSKVKSYNAIIQYEQNTGQQGDREIHLLIGVNPSLFDSFYFDIQKIGTIKAKEVTKVDKTNEYRELNAKRISIEKTLQSLIELKSKSGAIADFVSLNYKIMEIEEKLQDLGVELGNFDTENEFCTVRISMYEGSTEYSISFIHRVRVALEWSIRYFAIIVFTSMGLSVTLFILLLIIDKLKLMNVVNKKINE